VKLFIFDPESLQAFVADQLLEHLAERAKDAGNGKETRMDLP
jgi:hypothetical protein